MAVLINGIYEQIINNVISSSLEQMDSEMYDVIIEKFDAAESTKILSNYLRRIMLEIFSYVEGEDRVSDRIQICNSILQQIRDRIQSESYGFKRNKEIEEKVSSYFIKQDAGVLMSYVEKRRKTITRLSSMGVRPETSIAENTLFTNAPHEPNMISELKKEILTCDQIDFIVSFVKWSGLRLMLDELREFTENGGRLRLISTSYMGATDFKAIDQLSKLRNTEIRISFDTKRTRLHAKTYVFWRNTGFSTVYIGSSNISESAVTAGLEWNIKLSEYDSRDVLEKVRATFESYWNKPEFELYHKELSASKLKNALISERMNAQKESSALGFNFDVRPYFYQQEILDKLKAARKVHGQHRNLVVAATGTGKTLISAFDYRDFIKENKEPESRNRILFVAHRKEILEQSLKCFRGVLRNQNFGALMVGNHTSENLEHLFVSIQSFNSKALIEETNPDFYDFIVIDEIHHGAAPSYREILTYYRPKVLLGLTATPERADGQDILQYFDGITAELRLYEAIERKLLSPFHYFGVTDPIDLRNVKWSSGRYDESELENLFVFDKKVAEMRAGYVLQSISNYALEEHEIKGLGFCVSKKHAEFMADIFNKSGIPSTYLTAESTPEHREGVKSKLLSREFVFIFVVDLYNEGVDIPEVNTVLFLRPTESLTVFLQQLGRGLRLSEEKEALTVLDFVGQANNKFSFADRFRAMMGKTRNTVEEEIKKGFVNVPRGCSIQLEKVAQEHILQNIRGAINNRKNIITKLGDQYSRTGRIDAGDFFRSYHIKPYEVYGKNMKSTLTDIAIEAKIIGEYSRVEHRNASVFLRMAMINSSRLLNYMLKVLQTIRKSGGQKVYTESEEERRLLLMCYYTFFTGPIGTNFDTLEKAIYSVIKDDRYFEECISLIHYMYDQIDFVSAPLLELGSENPLDLHCSYSRDLILAALGKSNETYKYPSREGTLYIGEADLDVFFVTLNKSEKEYSPTTMYQDYIINEELFHWQSQSTTSVESKTGLRYINQRKSGNQVLLFVREYTKDESGTSPYVCLGLVEYEEHSGSLPISIKYRLKHSIPGKLLENSMIV